MSRSLFAPLAAALLPFFGCAAETDTDAGAAQSVAEAASDDETVDLAGPRVEVGAAARVYVDGARWIYLALDQDAMNELLDAQNASNVDLLRRLGQAGRVFRVPNNTDVRVTDRSTLLTKVRVTEAGRVYSDREGWVQYEFVRPVVRSEATPASLPDYRVLDKVGGYIDVLVPSLSADTPRDVLARVARAIADQENVSELSLYLTEDAYRANFSASYAKQHPNALEEGYLGAWRNGSFEPSIY